VTSSRSSTKIALPLTMTSDLQPAISAALSIVSSAVHAHQDFGSAACGQLADRIYPAAGIDSGHLAWPAGVDRQHQHQVG